MLCGCCLLLVAVCVEVGRVLLLLVLLCCRRSVAVVVTCSSTFRLSLPRVCMYCHPPHSGAPTALRVSGTCAGKGVV